MSSTRVYVWRKLAFILLSINVLRYTREGASASPPFVGPTRLGGFSAARLRRTCACAFPGLGRAARPEAMAPPSHCQRVAENTLSSAAAAPPAERAVRAGEAPSHPSCPSQPPATRWLAGRFFTGHQTTDDGLTWVLSHRAEQSCEDLVGPSDHYYRLFLLRPKPHLPSHVPGQST